jgi:hypothetical protein
MKVGAISLHGVDLVEIYQALTNNVQLGVGAAVPALIFLNIRDCK